MKQQRKRHDKGAFLTTGSVARLLGCAPRTVSMMCDQHGLPHFRLPGSADRRIARTELAAYLTRNGVPLVRGLLGAPKHLLVIAPASSTLTIRLSDWSVQQVSCLFEAGCAWAAQRHQVVLMDLAAGQTDCVRAARWLAKQPGAPVLVAVCGEDGIRDEVRSVFACVWDGASDAVGWLRNYAGEGE